MIQPRSPDSDRAAFEVKQALASARGLHPTRQIIVAATPEGVAALEARGATPYLDRYLTPPAVIATRDDLLEPTTATAILRILPDDRRAAEIVATAAALAGWFPERLVPVPDRHVSCGAGRAVPAYLNPATLDLAAVSEACPSDAVLQTDMPGATVDRYTLDRLAAFLVHAGTGERFASGVDVEGARELSADEIVARHQAAAARQSAGITTSIDSGTLTLTFEAPGFVAPVTVTSRTTIYRSPERTDVRQADIRVDGVRFDAHGGVPRLPIIEPERAAAPPLAITLTDVYDYRLDGRETIDGRPCYVVAFAPRDRTASLYRGRAWIDVAGFAMVRVSAVQTGLRGPIISSEQTDAFAPDPQGRWVLVKSDVRQTYEGASVRTPIHRLLLLDGHEINPPDFDARRAAAYRSSDVMLRDTPDGFRYLRKEAGAAGGDTPSEEPARVVAGRASRIRTLAFGAIVDPNISRPLPFAGLSYVDFDLFGTGAQFNGFFGGSYGQLAFSAPSLAGSRWQLAGRAFGLATSYNDRAFVNGREQYERDIRQRPAQAAVWLLRPLGPRVSMRFEYDWDYNRFGRTDITAPDFVVPRNQNAHAARIGIDAQIAGWQASGWVSRAHRIGWRPWGSPGAAPDDGYRPEHATFDRFGASLLQSQSISPRVTTRLEASVMGGRHLDRFSRIAFGTFDNRLHGYPSALIRYDRGGVLRTAISWAAARAVRLDGFADAAGVHDPAFGPGIRPYLGFGAAIESAAPFGTLVALEWGYGVQGLNTDGRRGTHVVRISGYKIF